MEQSFWCSPSLHGGDKKVPACWYVQWGGKGRSAGHGYACCADHLDFAIRFANVKRRVTNFRIRWVLVRESP